MLEEALTCWDAGAGGGSSTGGATGGHGVGGRAAPVPAPAPLTGAPEPGRVPQMGAGIGAELDPG